MNISRNPARSRPLSANVRRLMKMERESPQNPNVLKVHRAFEEKDIAYCEMQGEIFMAAVDKGIGMDEFAPMFMNSQLAGVIDYSFSCAKGMEEDEIASLLQVPLLLKSPDVIVDVTVWLDKLVSQLHEGSQANIEVINACMSNEPFVIDTETSNCEDDISELADKYEYAYWLGYIYRYESLLHEESSRMVYGAFDEKFMREMYMQMMQDRNGGDGDDVTLAECADEICRRLDMLLVGNLWKNK